MSTKRERWIVQRFPSGEVRCAVCSTLEVVIGRAYILREEMGHPTMVIEDGHVVVDFNETLAPRLPAHAHAI
jgi:hypothetical protein